MITWKFGYSYHLSDIASFISCWAVLPQQLAVGFRVTENFNFLVDLRLPKPPGFWSFRNLFQTVDWCKNLYHDSLKTGKIAANLHYFMRQQPIFRNLKDTSRIPQWWSQILSLAEHVSNPAYFAFHSNASKSVLHMWDSGQCINICISRRELHKHDPF